MTAKKSTINNIVQAYNLLVRHVDEDARSENTLRAYGADIRMVSGTTVNEARRKRRELVKKIVQTENAINLDQYSNPANPNAHVQTAREILNDVPNVKTIIIPVSTGGQLSGIGGFFKKYKP